MIVVQNLNHRSLPLWAFVFPVARWSKNGKITVLTEAVAAALIPVFSRERNGLMSNVRSRRRQATFDDLLDAAHRLAKKDGWEGVTIRKIASEVGMTSAAIYRYVESKDDLVAELVRRGFITLVKAMEKSSEKSEDALIGAVEAYMAFARKNVELYRVMYGFEGAPMVESTWEQSKQVGTLILSAMVQTNRVQSDDIGHPAVLQLWATIHGLIVLSEAGRLPFDPLPIARRAVTLVAPD